MITLLPADTFSISNKTIMDTNFDILTKLYQPIIGGLSLSLYYLMYSLLDKKEISSKEYTHHYLVNSLKFKLPDILEAREKLEALGLIKTYIKEGNINKYIYELYSPISANEFLNNPILNVLLFNTIGKEEYERIVEYFAVPSIDMNNYKNITRKFSEVFELVSYKSFELSIVDAKKYNYNKILVDNKIDFDLLLSGLPKNISSKINKNIKELITNLSFVYNLDTLDLEKIIKNSIDENGIMDKVKLRKLARSYYKFENNGKLPNIVYKNQPENLKREFLDKSNISKMIYVFENTTPYDYLMSKQSGALPVKRDLNLIEELIVDYGLTPGVVNVLIDYVLKTNNNKLSRAYIETIAGSWKRYNIKTVTEAIDIAKKEHKKYNKITKVSKTNKEVNVPDWFDEKVDKKEISKEEEENLSKLLEEFR